MLQVRDVFTYLVAKLPKSEDVFGRERACKHVLSMEHKIVHNYSHYRCGETETTKQELGMGDNKLSEVIHGEK